MTKGICCDRCGKWEYGLNREQTYWLYGVNRIAGRRFRTDLCCTCAHELEEWVSEKIEDQEDAASAREGLEAHARGETIPWERVRAELGEPG
jgi:hypothetical protein